MRKQWKGFIAGLVVAVMAFGLSDPAVAALVGKTIEVYTGVNIYVDDVKLNPTDANGNPVEVFVYNGTTYLPVRAVGEAVGKTVQWEGKTNSVYLGKHTGEKPAVWLVDLDYFMGMSVSHSAQQDNMGNSYPQAIGENFNGTYVINGQYSAISGTLFQKYEYRSYSSNMGGTLDIYGDGELLYSAKVGPGIQPIDFYVDITGVLNLKVDFYYNVGSNQYYYDERNTYAAIANCGLWT